MDEGQELDTPEEGETAPTATSSSSGRRAPEPDAVVREGSEIAAYWHGVARGED